MAHLSQMSQSGLEMEVMYPTRVTRGMLFQARTKSGESPGWKVI